MQELSSRPWLVARKTSIKNKMLMEHLNKSLLVPQFRNCRLCILTPPVILSGWRNASLSPFSQPFNNSQLKLGTLNSKHFVQ